MCTQGLRAISRRDQRACGAVIVVSVVALLSLDMRVDRLRNRLVGTLRLVLADHRGAFAVVAHPRHQISQACTARGRQVIAGMAEIMKVQALSARDRRLSRKRARAVLHRHVINR
jgi:hypothetical protein